MAKKSTTGKEKTCDTKKGGGLINPTSDYTRSKMFVKLGSQIPSRLE